MMSPFSFIRSRTTSCFSDIVPRRSDSLTSSELLPDEDKERTEEIFLYCYLECTLQYRIRLSEIGLMVLR